MSQFDWVGDTPPPAPFKDIRNQRSATAERKAYLMRELGDLINRVPRQIMASGIERTREWRTARDAAAKIAGSARSSINDLTRAITNMRRFSEPQG